MVYLSDWHSYGFQTAPYDGLYEVSDWVPRIPLNFYEYPLSPAPIERNWCVLGYHMPNPRIKFKVVQKISKNYFPTAFAAGALAASFLFAVALKTQGFGWLAQPVVEVPQVQSSFAWMLKELSVFSDWHREWSGSTLPQTCATIALSCLSVYLVSRQEASGLKEGIHCLLSKCRTFRFSFKFKGQVGGPSE